jgi:hypothetical protein
MRFLVRQDEIPTRGTGGGEPESGLESLRVQGRQHLDAADAAIRNALGTSDSETFLQAGRQEGGQ